MTKITIGSVQGNVTIIRCKSSVVHAPVTALHCGHGPIHPPHCPRRCLCLALLLTAAQLVAALAGPACVGAGPDASGQWPAPSVALQPVRSDAIAALGYDASTCQMFIAFVRGKQPYTYCAVPPEVFAAFMAAPSKGTY